MTTSQQSSEIYQKRVHLAVDQLRDHLNQPLDLTELARLAGFSPYHFSRIFTAVMGETPMKYILRLRLEAAANLLLKSTRPLTAIALENGFSSSSTFARAFRRYFQCSPSEYRAGWGYMTGLSLNRAVDERLQLGEYQISSAKIRWQEALPVVYVATYSGYAREKICAAWNRLQRWAMLHQVFDAETRALGISLDDPYITPMERCRYYACFTLPHNFIQITNAPVNYLTIPEGQFAVFQVKSSAEELPKVYQALFSEWLLQSGYQPANMYLYEAYLDAEVHPDRVMQMEIHIPIEPIST
jgi:AraC family transcriptional regulator